MLARKAPWGAFFFAERASNDDGSESSHLASPFWLIAWAVTLSWCWLLPNHYPPWSAFHADAWAAFALLPMAATVLWRSRGDHHVSRIAGVVLVLSFMPVVQYGAGLIQMAGTAWLAFAYLLAFALAIMVGNRWERYTPGQLGDGLFVAIGIASVFSVGIQLHQWLRLEMYEVWLIGNQNGRPYANMAQPNQLATLLLWGLLALAWAGIRGYVRPMMLILAAIYLLFGLALTASRTSWLGLCILFVASWYWRGLWPWRRGPWVVTALVIGFFGAVWLIPVVGHALLLDLPHKDLDDVMRISTESRPRIWAMFLEAATLRPWAGYGWNQVALAHVEVAAEQPPLLTFFAHSHNLFLDLILWCGLPVGLFLVVGLCLWLWRRFHATKDASGALMLLMVVIVGNHAMLELPLHYAYFLLPTGLVIGALDTRSGSTMLALGRAWTTGSMWLACFVMLGVLTYEYIRIEASYQVLRFEWANVRSKADRNPPDVIMLNQLRSLIVYSRFEPGPGMGPAQLDWMRKVASIYPSSGVIHKYAAALAWNGQPEEAALWLRRMCALAPESQCGAVKRSWIRLAASDPLIAKVNWK